MTRLRHVLQASELSIDKEASNTSRQCYTEIRPLYHCTYEGLLFMCEQLFRHARDMSLPGLFPERSIWPLWEISGHGVECISYDFSYSYAGSLDF